MDLWKSIFQFDRLDRLKRFVGLGEVEKDDTAVRIGVVGAAKVGHNCTQNYLHNETLLLKILTSDCH